LQARDRSSKSVDSLGLQRGELIRKLILDELARDSGSVPASTELTEIMGIRLMLTNLFRPLATGQKLTHVRAVANPRMEV
jgi:hypothetical protein